MSHAQKSDRTLIDEVLKGNSSAWCVLVFRHHERLASQVFRLLEDIPGRDDRLRASRTIVKATFLAARRTLQDCQLEKSFSTWLDKIASRLITRHLLDCGKWGNCRNQEEVIAAVNRLPPDLRAVLVLREMEGLKYTEIAEITGDKVEIIRQRLHRARLELLKLLQEQEPG